MPVTSRQCFKLADVECTTGVCRQLNVWSPIPSSEKNSRTKMKHQATKKLAVPVLDSYLCLVVLMSLCAFEIPLVVSGLGLGLKK